MPLDMLMLEIRYQDPIEPKTTDNLFTQVFSTHFFLKIEPFAKVRIFVAPFLSLSDILPYRGTELTAAQRLPFPLWGERD